MSPGERYLADTLFLRGHSGTQPDLFLRWNAIPDDATSIDVVIHLHGFSQRGAAMFLAEKVPVSGLDLSGRERPTLAIMPRGNWIRHTWFDFPGLLDGRLDPLIDYIIRQFTRGYPLDVDRLILTAHSGGGMPAIDIVAGMKRKPDELFLFDGLYGRDPRSGDPPLKGIEIIEAWLDERLAEEPERPGALRVLYIEAQTGPFSRALATRVRRKIDAAAAAAAGDDELRANLARRYRVEHSVVPHAFVASFCCPFLLADAGADIDWSRF
jgi:hypothetical protein